MKKLFSFIMVFALLFSFTACSNNNDSSGTSDLPALQTNQPGHSTAEETASQSGSLETSSPESGTTEGVSRSLVVYFSWSGNTESVARSIQSQTDSDIFELIPQTPYSDDYNTVLDIAQEEQRTDARPAISGSIDNIEQYDVIYVGFPNWWGDMPMILYTFFDSYDLSGKTIAPFCTSGGSGFSGTINTMKSLEPNATVIDGLHIGSSSASNPDSAVSGWLNETGLAK